MQPNYAALKAAMATGGQYAGLTDTEAVSACNAATVSVNVDIPMSAVLEYFALAGKLPLIQGWAKSAPSGVSAEATVAAQTFGAIIGPPPLFSSLRMSDPAANTAITNMVSALVSAGLLTSADQSAVLGQSVQKVAQSKLWGWSNGIIDNDLVAARNWP